MRIGLVSLLGLWAGVATAVPPAPLAWSPDGHWLAYTVVGSSEAPSYRLGWIYDGKLTRLEKPSQKVGSILLVHPETNASVLVARSEQPLSSPAWSQQGDAVAFVRITPNGPDGPRFEVVVRSRIAQERVVLSRALDGEPSSQEDLAARVPAWSPDGRYLVIPIPRKSDGLLVIRPDNGRVLKRLDGCIWAAWSPESSRLAIVRGGESPGLELVDVSFGPPRRLIDLGQALQPPAWSADGQSILVPSHRRLKTGGGETCEIQLLRVAAETGVVESIASLCTSQDESAASVAISLDRDGENLVWSVDQANEPAAAVWFRPPTRETLNRFHPIDTLLPIGSLALAPRGDLLALRLGRDPLSDTVAVWDSTTRHTTALLPDDRTREAWIALLLDSAGQLLRAALPQAVVAGRPIVRATALPVPGEIPSTQETAFRLRALGRLGRTLCDSTDGGTAGVTSAFRLESSVVFDVLREDHAAAMEGLERIEQRTDEPGERLRLLALRTQCLLGLGEPDRARDAIKYLQAYEARQPLRLESTPAGFVLTPEPSRLGGWAGFLASRFEELVKGPATAEPSPEGPGLRLPEAPATDLRFEALDPFGLRR